MENNILDANAVLRFILKDNDEQFEVVRKIIQNEYCCVTLEVIAEVCYVLERLYKVPRDKIIEAIRRLNGEASIYNADVLFRAFEIYVEPPKMDFVDCLMYGYKTARGYNVITFDKKLNAKLRGL